MFENLTLEDISISTSTIVVGIFTAFAVVVVYYFHYVFVAWENDFSANRVQRTSTICPSNQQAPKLSRFDIMQSTIVANSELHKAFADCELIADVKVRQKDWKENAVIRERARAVPFLGSMGEKQADKLDMDHVYISFRDFLWGYIWIGPFSYLLWKKGTIILKLRQVLIKYGIIKYKECEDIEKLVATLLLEQSQVIHYFARTKDGSELGNIAGFFFADFPYVDNNLKYQVADLFAVDIDLDTKKFVKAKLDDISLTAQETLILVWFNTIATQHVKLHAMANWGINQHESIRQSNAFLFQNSVVTAIYNYFGYSKFSNFLRYWEEQGLLSEGWFENGCFIQCVNHGISHGVGQHGNITDLVKHSNFVNFIVKVRSIFMNQFAKYKNEFPGVDGEAFFIGTIMHSLDHTLMEWNLPDPLWLDIDNERFGKMAELGRIVRVGFVQDVPGLYFTKRFKDSDHPFYKTVYKKAAKIDKKLADYMDTCIVK